MWSPQELKNKLNEKRANAQSIIDKRCGDMISELNDKIKSFIGIGPCPHVISSCNSYHLADACAKQLTELGFSSSINDDNSIFLTLKE